MTQQLILRIKQDGEPRCLHRFDVQSANCETVDVSGWSDQTISGKKVMLLLPASWVYHSTTHIASKNPELLAKSVPFAIEEELSNEVDENYFAFNLNGDGSQNVVAIEKKYLDSLLPNLNKAKIKIEYIHSEVDWLPLSDKTAYLWHDEDSTLVRFESEQSMRMANAQVNQMLPVFGKNVTQIISNIDLQIDSSIETSPKLTAAQCCVSLLNANPIDLHVDAINSNKNSTETHNWQSVKWLAAALILSWVTISSYQLVSLNGSVSKLKNMQQTLFSERFSGAAASELVDPYAAYQSRLQLQNTSSNGQSDVLIESLNALGKTLVDEQMVKIKGLRLIDEKIEIQVTAPAMSVINGFHQQLQQNANSYNVQIGVNELADDSSFRSIITMVPR